MDVDEKTDEARRRYMVGYIDVDDLVEVLEGRKRVVNLPLDAKVEHVFAAHEARGFGIFYSSETFDYVPRGHQAPMMFLEFGAPANPQTDR